MKNYDHNKIEKKWQKEWDKNKTYKTLNKGKKMYVLDMFPYPSGVGLHVGHPRGYIGSDVYARMKRMQGYNVLHPMGYDAFGLPAEQYALQHKIHPKKAVDLNVKTFERQLSIIGLSYDWSRKVNTTDPKYYRWTQWIFLQIYNSWFDKAKNKARKIEELINIFEKSGNAKVNAVSDGDVKVFTAKEWNNFSKKEKEDLLMKYRLAYEGHSEVNWCPHMGTVLANDEIVNDANGNPVSERGGYPVEKKSMRQWFMRITAYADRLLSGLDGLEWSDHIKEIQKNWIGKSEGSEIEFSIKNYNEKNKSIYHSRRYDIWGDLCCACARAFSCSRVKIQNRKLA
jgi:leucyl-tRNA synthetase